MSTSDFFKSNRIPGGTPPSIGRRQMLGTALAAGATLAFPALSRAQAPAQKGVLRIGFIGPAKRPAAVTGWALQQGHLQRELAPLGFSDVVTRVFANGPDLNEAFLSGALDIGIYGDTPAVVARSRGLDGRLIGFENVGMNVWLLTPKGGVTSIKELDGKVVAVALGSYMHRYVLGTLKEAGIARSVKVVYMLPRDGEPALERGSIAAFAAPIDTGPLLASRGYPVLDEAARHPDLRGSTVIVASKNILDKAPGLQAAWGRARLTALQEIRRDSERYYQFHAEVSGFPIAVVKTSHPISQFAEEPYPAEGNALLNGTRKFLLAENLIREDVDLAQWRGASAG